MASSSAVLLRSDPTAATLKVVTQGSVDKFTRDYFIAESSRCDAHPW